MNQFTFTDRIAEYGKLSWETTPARPPVPS